MLLPLPDLLTCGVFFFSPKNQKNLFVEVLCLFSKIDGKINATQEFWGQELSTFASCLKECSESLDKIFCFFDPTTL